MKTPAHSKPVTTAALSDIVSDVVLTESFESNKVAISEKLKSLSGDSQYTANELELLKSNESLIANLATFATADENVYLTARRVNTSTTSNPSEIKSTRFDVNLGGGFGGYRNNNANIMDSASNESFARSNQSEFVKSLLDYNISAAQQDEYNREFWRLRMIQANQNGVTYSIPKLGVYRQNRLSNTGSSNYYEGLGNVWDAVQDPEILEGDFIDMVPVCPTAAANPTRRGEFDIFKETDTSVLGVDVKTAPLLAKDAGNARAFNYISLSRTNIGGLEAAMEGIDTIAPGSSLAAVFFKTDIDVGGTPTETRLKVDTSGFPRAQYQDSSEGSAKESTLTFRDSEIKLPIATLAAYGGVAIDTFAIPELADANVVITMDVTSTLNNESGQLSAPSVNSVKVLRIVAPASGGGVTTYKADEAIGVAGVQTAMDLLKAIFTTTNYHSFMIKARATNHSHREEGLIVHKLNRNYNVYAMPRSPITIQTESTGRADVDPAPIKEAAEVARIRRNNDGVKEVLSFCDYLYRAIGSIVEEGSRPFIGMASDLIRPYYFKDTFNVYDNLTSVQSAQKVDDIAGALTTYLELQIHTAIRESHYQGTLGQMYPGEKPRVIIGTDPVTANYIIRRGDSRLFGDNVDVKVVTTDVKDHYNRVVMTLSRSNRGDGDFLSSGECVSAPDFVADINPAASGGAKMAHIRSHRINPAYTFVPVLPIVVDIQVDDLLKAATLAGVVNTTTP